MVSTDPASKTILVVDDDRPTAEFFDLLLSREGFEVMTSHGGHDALRLLRTDSPHHFDLIVLDLMMPQLGGYEVLKELEKPEYQQIPVFVVTARALDTGTVRMLREEHNVKDFWTKPVNPIEFKKGIHLLLGTVRQ